MSGSVFGSAHSFLHSTTLRDIGYGVAAFIALFYCATVYWVYKDARRRIAEPGLVALATVVGAIPPFLGPFVYMLFRPPEYLEDVRERELEIKTIETRLGGPEFRCSVCGSPVADDYLVCPVCTTKLRQACTNCGKPLEPAWQVCPYCESPAGVDGQLTLAERPPRPTRSRR